MLLQNRISPSCRINQSLLRQSWLELMAVVVVITRIRNEAVMVTGHMACYCAYSGLLILLFGSYNIPLS